MRDFFWGEDQGFWMSVLAGALKLVVSVALAYLIHECIFVKATTSGLEAEFKAIQANFSKASDILAAEKIPYAICPFLTTVDSNSKSCHFAPTKSNDPNFEFGYQISDLNSSAPKNLDGTFFEIGDVLWTSHPTLRDSVDVLIRRVEQIAFNHAASTNSTGKTGEAAQASAENAKTAPVTTPRSGADLASGDVRLCVGSRQPLESHYCAISDTLRRTFIETGSGADTLASILERLRLRTLVLGPIQFVTLVVFIFTLIEIWGLGLRWVSPADRTFTIASDGNLSQLAIDAKTINDSIAASRASAVRGLGDRLFTRALAAAAHVSATPQAIVATIESHRVYLLDDAVARQEKLEMHGDTMLKIAFMGTVYGIGSALYAARQLDAADPLVRLVAKSDMYAGIGLGFGATLVGILLSIIAAKFRSSLAESWAERVSTAYRLVSDWGPNNLLATAENTLSEETKKKLSGLHVLPAPSGLHRFLTGLGRLTVFLLLCAVVVYVAFTRLR